MIVAVVFLASCEEDKTIYMQPPSYVDVNRQLDDVLSPPGHRRDDCAHCSEDEPNRVPVGGNEACKIPGTSSKWQNNCNSILSSGSVPKEAFLYTLAVMKKNATGFKSDKCYKLADKEHYSMNGLTRDKFETMMSAGIPNKCQMMINNYDERISTHDGKHKCKTAQYYIDLCSSSPKVQKSFSYVGYGTCKTSKPNVFTNKSGKGTTVLGAFLTGNNVFNFQKRDTAYTDIANSPGFNGKVPATPLIGLQKSNNGAAPDYKYLHVGAYTSAGCPSVPPQDKSKVEALAKNGPSLVVNYKHGLMEDIGRCSQ